MLSWKQWDNPCYIYLFSCVPLHPVRWNIYCVLLLSFTNPSHSTPLRSQASECLSHCFSYSLLLYPLLLSIPTLDCSVLYVFSLLHPTSASPFSSRLSGFHQVSPLAPYWRPPGSLQARRLRRADNLPWGCPVQANTFPVSLPWWQRNTACL